MTKKPSIPANDHQVARRLPKRDDDPLVKERASRLVIFREKAGYDSARSAAIAMGIPVASYVQLENGTRRISLQNIEPIARFLSFKPEEVFYGRGPLLIGHVAALPQSGGVRPSSSPGVNERVDIVGILSDNSRIVTVPDNAKMPKTVARPLMPIEEVIQAIAVTNNDQYPAFRAGDAVYFQPDVLPSNLAAIECVIRTNADEMLIRFVTEQANGLFTLTTYNKPPVTDVNLISASPILWIQRNAFAT